MKHLIPTSLFSQFVSLNLDASRGVLVALVATLQYRLGEGQSQGGPKSARDIWFTPALGRRPNILANKSDALENGYFRLNGMG